jgi:hypothetical protein
MRNAATNGVWVHLMGVLDIVAYIVPISKEDSHIHSYCMTEDNNLYTTVRLM